MTTVSTSSRTRFISAAGACCAAGGLLFVGLGIAGDAVGTGRTGFDLWMALATGGIVLMIVGLLGLARSGLAGPGPLAAVGLVAAIAGMVGFGVAHAIAAFDASQSESPLFRIGSLAGIGMVLAGSAVLRAGRWTGWGRFTPLAAGLYPLVILIPAFAIFGEPNFPAIAGSGIPWLLLGVALYRTTDSTAIATAR